jgi:hypothetical protein
VRQLASRDVGPLPGWLGAVRYSHHHGMVKALPHEVGTPAVNSCAQTLPIRAPVTVPMLGQLVAALLADVAGPRALAQDITQGRQSMLPPANAGARPKPSQTPCTECMTDLSVALMPVRINLQNHDLTCSTSELVPVPRRMP